MTKFRNSHVRYHDSGPIAVAADEVKDYWFSWSVPDTVMYVVEVSLVPTWLEAYDVSWMNVG